MLFSDAMLENRRALNAATTPQMRKLLPVLKQAEREMARGLGVWVSKQAPTDRYTVHRHRALLAQLRTAIATIERKAGPALSDDMRTQGTKAQRIGMTQLEKLVEAGSQEFEGAIRPLRIDVAAVLTNERRTMIGQVDSSATRYGREVHDDIRNRLMLGVVRNETIDQMTSRLLASTGMIRVFKRLGPARAMEGAAGAIFNSYRSHAETIARTEMVNAYATVQARAIREADREDPGYLKKWDAAADKRVCRWCAMLDEVTVKPNELFPRIGRFARRPHSPLHPRCRCAVVPWRREWTFN